MTLCGKQLKIVMTAKNVLFWKHESLVFGLWTWCVFLTVILCVFEFVQNFLGYLHLRSLMKMYIGMEQVKFIIS